ncbi:tetratricopeptide repeat protein [Desulfonema limicola]|nr:tetratricopeptide repeat protein [Desulfonema limicola]
MQIYANLFLLGLIGTALLAFAFFQMINIYLSFSISVLAYIIFIMIVFINTRTWLTKEHEKHISSLKEKYEGKIQSLRNEYDTAMLEKTIRNGTKTLIKNAVDYFKVENIKNEMPPSAAIQNLQLDKYGQIIELLADFSLILPDYDENRQIVLQEITHQIDIFLIDEKPFAEFLQTIMGKYLLTVNKKIREKIRQNVLKHMKACPNCSERVSNDARICKHCGHQFIKSLDKEILIKKENGKKETGLIKKGYDLYQTGRFEEAIKCFSIAIKMNPRADQAYYGRGFIYNKINKYQKAVKDIQYAARLGHEKAQEFLSTIQFSETQEYESALKKQAGGENK